MSAVVAMPPVKPGDHTTPSVSPAAPRGQWAWRWMPTD